MRIVAYKVKCDRFIIIYNDKIAGDCFIKESTDKEAIKTCKIDEDCKLQERLKRFIPRYISS